VAPHLDREGVGIADCFDLEFLQFLQQEAIAVPASDEISQPQLVLAHSLCPRALAAFEAEIGFLDEARPGAVHKGFVVEVAESLLVILPPSSLLLFSRILRLQVTWLAVAMADSLGQSRSSFRKWIASPRGYMWFRETVPCGQSTTRSLCLYRICICMKP